MGQSEVKRLTNEELLKKHEDKIEQLARTLRQAVDVISLHWHLDQDELNRGLDTQIIINAFVGALAEFCFESELDPVEFGQAISDGVAKSIIERE